MYPARIGFQSVLNRINALRANGHSAEALVTSVFTMEKLMRRTVRVAIVARGFSSLQTNRLLERKGFGELRDMWDIFDKTHEKLPSIVGQQDWQHIPEAVKARNELVHGHKVFSLSYCDALAGNVVSTLEKLHIEIVQRYGHDPWSKIKVRKIPRLQWML